MMNEMEQRIADIIRQYDRQGDHRTGTDVDLDSARWLAAHIEAIGLRPQLQHFDFERLDIQTAEISAIGRRCTGVPLFDCAAYTGPEGISGRLGDVRDWRNCSRPVLVTL